MSQDLINRYQSGGDIYAALLAKYGQTTADAVAQAALSGDETQVNAALAQGIYGNPLDTSTVSILTQQLATNPLGAPLDAINNVIGNTFSSLFSSKYVVIVLIAAGFLWLGGLEYLKGSLSRNLKK